MLLINGFVRYLFLLAAFATFFCLEGGHLIFFFADTLVVQQLFVFALSMAFYMETLNPQTPEQLRQTRFAGLSGATIAIILTVISAFIHFANHYNQTRALGAFLGVLAACLLHVTIIYFSFFHWAFGPRAFEGLAVTQKFFQLRKENRVWRVIRRGANYLFCGIGILVCLAFVVLGFIANREIFFTENDRKVEAIKKASRDSIEKQADDIEAKFTAKNCKPMSRSEKWKIEDDLRDKQIPIDDEKIYKIYHGDDKDID